MLPTLNKPIFIVCLHRTGSTLFKNILDLNPEVAMATDEMQIYHPFFKTFADEYKRLGTMDEPTIDRMVDLIFDGDPRRSFWKNHHRLGFWKDYRQLGIPRKQICEAVKKTDRSLRSIIAVLLDEYRRKQEKPRVGVKYPLHISKIHKLYDWFPGCKVLFLTRDIRAVFASKAETTGTGKRKSRFKFLDFFVHYMTLLYFVFEFYWSAKVFLKFKDHPQFYKIRYEDLIIKPGYSLNRVCDFCELKFEEKMLHAYGKPSSFTGKAPRGFDASRIFAWKSRLKRFDKWLITILSKKSKKILGYENIETEYLDWTAAPHPL